MLISQLEVNAQTDLRDRLTKPKVVCFGDSITTRGYPAELAALLNVEAINAGVGGNSTAKGLKRITKDVLQKSPDIVVIFFGTNDLRVDTSRVHLSLIHI